MGLCVLDRYGLVQLKVTKHKDRERRDALLMSLTSFMFIGGLHVLLDMMMACGRMSLAFQPKHSCASSESRSVDHCLESLDAVATFEVEYWKQLEARFTPLPNGTGTFLGVPLTACDTLSPLKSEGPDFVQKCQENII